MVYEEVAFILVFYAFCIFLIIVARRLIIVARRRARQILPFIVIGVATGAFYLFSPQMFDEAVLFFRAAVNDYILVYFGPFFSAFKWLSGGLYQSLLPFFEWIPPWAFIGGFAFIAYILTRETGLTATVWIASSLLWFFGIWDAAMITFAIVGASVIIIWIFAFPLGVAMSWNDRFESVFRPVLDLMQTMPAYVYLIPSIAFFGIGPVPAIFATFIYAAPPGIRLLNMGLRETPEEEVEAARSFGSTKFQTYMKVRMPHAISPLLQGITQTIMLAISMMVIAGLIGAAGLGLDVFHSLTLLKIGKSFVFGLGLVFLAIIIDRIFGAAITKYEETLLH